MKSHLINFISRFETQPFSHPRIHPLFLTLARLYSECKSGAIFHPAWGNGYFSDKARYVLSLAKPIPLQAKWASSCFESSLRVNIISVYSHKIWLSLKDAQTNKQNPFVKVSIGLIGETVPFCFVIIFLETGEMDLTMELMGKLW